MFFFLFLGIESEIQIGTRFNFDSIQKTQSWAPTLIYSSSSSSMRGAPLPPCDQYFVINI
jgi:hypothetical protein